MLPGIKGSHMLGSVGVALPALLNAALLPINNFKLLSICVGLAALRQHSYNGANVQFSGFSLNLLRGRSCIQGPLCMTWQHLQVRISYLTFV